MTDVRSLLDVPMDEIKKPPVLPVGDYFGFIEKYEPGESKQKKTKFIRFTFRLTRADESVPADMLQNADGSPIDLTKKSFRKDFYLLEDKSQHWRLKEFLEDLGIESEGKSMGAVLPSTTSKAVRISIGQRANDDNTEMFNEVGKVIADAS